MADKGPVAGSVGDVGTPTLDSVYLSDELDAHGHPRRFINITKGPFSLGPSVDNTLQTRFVELTRRNVSNFSRGLIIVNGITEVVPGSFAPAVQVLVMAEVRIVGYIAGVRSVLMIGGTGTPQRPSLVSAGWANDDDGESYDEIAIEARANWLAWLQTTPRSMDLYVTMKLWRGL
jgi:hypothetical protein